MAKLKDEQLHRLKKIQDACDDDLELDITKRHTRAGCGAGQKAPKEDTKKDTRNLLILIGVVFAVFIIFFAILALQKHEPVVMTIDEMHAANSRGELDIGQGYVYHGFSFIHFGGLWYSQVQQGDTLYDITFNNDPLSVETVPVEGVLSDRFKQGTVYITFDPDAYSIKHIAVANAGLSMSLVKGFGLNLTAGCTSNESALCQQTEVISCDDKDKAVIYFKEETETKLILEDNCVTVQGTESGLIRAKDRLLMRWYGIMD
jgi:hypothetical protein